MNFRIAVPTRDGAPVFDLGECRELSVVDIDSGRIVRHRTISVDPGDGDRMPRQLEAVDIQILIAGGVRPKILDALNRSRVNLVTGVSGETVEGLVAAFLDGFPATASHTDTRKPAG